MHHTPHPILLALLLLAAQGLSHAACYAVYSPEQHLLYRDSQSPVDLELPLQESLPARFGAGASLVVSNDGGLCPAHASSGPTQPFQWREPVRERIEIGADSWPATEGSRVYTFRQRHSFGPVHGLQGAGQQRSSTGYRYEYGPVYSPAGAAYRR